MAVIHVGLSKKEFGELVNVVFRLERNVKKLHSWAKEGFDSVDKESEHMKEVSDKTQILVREYEQKHIEKNRGQYTSLDDSTLLAHLRDLIHLVHVWHSHGSSHNDSLFNQTYEKHEKKYGHATSSIHKLNTWYRNPRYKHHKNKKRKPKNKDRPAGHVAPSADHGGHVPPVFHQDQQGTRLTGLLEKLKM